MNIRLIIILLALTVCDGAKRGSNNKKKVKKESENNNILKKPQKYEQNLDTNIDLQEAEMELLKNLEMVTNKYGTKSIQRLESLDRLAKNIYRQNRLTEVVEYAKEILQISTQIHGEDHLQTATALGNLASVYFKMNLLWQCESAMNRALRILIDHHGFESQEVLLHRAQMERFGIHGSLENVGISYEEYLEEMGNE